MLKEKLCRASFVAALSVVVCASGSSFAQDGTTTKKSGPVSAQSIRPFVRSETPANQAPNLYDAKSDEFDYFREDLGRQELSTKQKNRLEALANRVVYADPMDKPAADGKPFVDIYSLDNVYADDEEFVGLDDPDVMYADDENNALASFAKACNSATNVLSVVYGASASTGSANNGMAGSMPQSGPAMPMPTVTMDSGVMPGGMSGSVTTTPGGAPQAEKKSAGPSKNDDSNLIFPADLAVDNPFSEIASSDEDFDLFSADRGFVATATAPKQTGPGVGVSYGEEDPNYREDIGVEEK